MSTKEEVLDSLHGQTYRIRGLTSALPEDWPRALHPDYEEVKPAVDELIEKIGGRDAKREWLRRGDFANFAAAWWPYAGSEEFKTLALLTVWVIRWHDAIDDPEGRFYTDPDGAKEYIGDTVAFVQRALRIDEPDGEAPESPDPTIESFRVIGDSVSKAYDEDQRKVLFDEIERFVTSIGGIQDLLLSSRVPSVDEYWTVRNSSSAIGVGVALIEYAGQFSLPPDVRNHDAMRRLYDRTTFIVAIINDVVALKVRVALGNHVHIVPLLCANDAELGNSAQAAIDAALAQVQPAIDDFEAAAAELLASVAEGGSDGDDDDGTVAQNVEAFIKGCRHIMTGNLEWSLKCGRFGLDVEAGDEDGVEFELAPGSID